uniref:Palmitoyltransferase n=1 Tax=Trichuris muris TaxID=70415 RepID=A0A5S6R1Y5_TRIMR
MVEQISDPAASSDETHTLASYGSLGRLIHFGPIVTLACISCISIAALNCHMMWWPPEQSIWALLNVLSFIGINLLVLSNFFASVLVGPGYLPLKWQPLNVEETRYLQYCKICKGYKAPRSHHCRKCNRCILKMDHHCPWINNCCGFRNQRFFIMFLFWAVAGCIQAIIILVLFLYDVVFMPFRNCEGENKEPTVPFTFSWLLYSLLACSVSLGVIVSVGILLFMQIKLALKNRTSVEEYIVAKADARPRENSFIFPYDIGWKENFRQVFNSTGLPIGDGIYWPVANGCDQYTLTIEQLMQKEEKRIHSEECSVVRNYNGGYLCFGLGWKVFLSQPILTQDQRLPLKVGERVTVSRGCKHWLYGCKESADCKFNRGWFPRQCVMLSEFIPNTAFREGENGILPVTAKKHQ